MPIPQSANTRLRPISAAAVGTNAGVSASVTAQTGQKYVVTHISASGDAAALVTIESPAGTILWKKRFAAAFNMSEHFTDDEYVGASGQAVVAKVSASTSNSEANIGGYAVLG